MKKQFLIIGAISAMTIASCGGSNEPENQDDVLQDDIELTDETENDQDMDVSEDDIGSTDETSSSDEWNEVLDDYEAYVDDYIAIIKKQKADPSDMSIMTEYQGLMQKGTEWSTKMSEM